MLQNPGRVSRTALDDYETLSTRTGVGTTGETKNAANDATKGQLCRTAIGARIAIDILTRLIYWRNGSEERLSGLTHTRRRGVDEILFKKFSVVVGPGLLAFGIR